MHLHHPVFGHVFVLAQVMAGLPKNARSHYLADQLRQTYPDKGHILFLDTWPISILTLVVASPTTLTQNTTKHILLKVPLLRSELLHCSRWRWHLFRRSGG